MKRNHISIMLTWLIFFLFIAVFLNGCSRSDNGTDYVLSGTVMEKINGILFPISGAEVEITANGLLLTSVKTDQAGAYSSNTATGVYPLYYRQDASAKGFYLGWIGGLPKVAIGGPSATSPDGCAGFRWDGKNTFSVHGDIIASGNIQMNAVSDTYYSDSFTQPGALSLLSGVNILTVPDDGSRIASIVDTLILVTANITIQGGRVAYRQTVSLSCADDGATGNVFYTIHVQNSIGTNYTRVSILRNGNTATTITHADVSFMSQGESNLLISGGNWITNCSATATHLKRNRSRGTVTPAISTPGLASVL